MSALYLHIPFCKKICYYCDFYFSLSLKNKTEMVNALAQEIKERHNYLEDKKLKTIYFGGGTPSVLSYDEISFLFDTISQYFDLSECVEISFEANPDDLADSYIHELLKTPINRLSIGIQSFNDKDLKLMNRRHSSKEGINCLNNVFNAGFDNVTTDLMYALPDMTLKSLESNIQTMLQFPINHISAYNLTVEEGTAFYGFKKKGQLQIPSDAIAIEQGNFLRKSLENSGFEQYEISNFAKNLNYSIHNTSYWNQTKYLGIGPSAHSYDGSSRQWNISNNRKYLEAINTDSSYYEREILTKEDQFNEYVFTRLRTKWGIDEEHIKQVFGSAYFEHFAGAISATFSQNDVKKIGSNYILTDSGKAIADGIASNLFFIED